MDWSLLVSHSPARWGLPWAVFAAVYGAFHFMEQRASPEIRSDLTRFLKDRSYEPYLGRLPNLVQTTFNGLFGKKHISKKCVAMSFLISILSVLITLSFTFIYNHEAVSDIILNYSKALNSLIGLLNKSENYKNIGYYLEHLGQSGLWTIVVLTWLFWCLIPDYLSLLKTRIILLLMSGESRANISLVVTIFVDFIVGIWIFLSSFVLLQIVIIIPIWITNGTIQVQGISSLLTSVTVLGGLLFSYNAAFLGGTGLLFFGVPFANIFWASMLPSIWLWAYMISAILTRFILSAKPIFNVLTYILDVAKHPVRSLGVVAGGVAAGMCFIVLIALSLV